MLSDTPHIGNIPNIKENDLVLVTTDSGLVVMGQARYGVLGTMGIAMGTFYPWMSLGEIRKKGWYITEGKYGEFTDDKNNVYNTKSRVTGIRTSPTHDQGTNPKDALGATKTPLSLIPQTALVAEAEVFADGARKYGEFNWRVSKVRARVYIEAAMRHLASLLDGEDYTVENTHHAANVRACMGIYLDATMCGMLIDDRPVAGRAAEMMAEYERKQKDAGQQPDTKPR